MTFAATNWLSEDGTLCAVLSMMCCYCTVAIVLLPLISPRSSVDRLTMYSTYSSLRSYRKILHCVGKRSSENKTGNSLDFYSEKQYLKNKISHRAHRRLCSLLDRSSLLSALFAISIRFLLTVTLPLADCYRCRCLTSHTHSLPACLVAPQERLLAKRTSRRHPTVLQISVDDNKIHIISKKMSSQFPFGTQGGGGFPPPPPNNSNQNQWQPPTQAFGTYSSSRSRATSLAPCRRYRVALAVNPGAEFIVNN